MKMPYEEVSPLLDDLDEKLVNGRVSPWEHNKEYDAILDAAGWTTKEFEEEVDRRWSFAGNMQSVAPKVRYRN